MFVYIVKLHIYLAFDIYLDFNHLLLIPTACLPNSGLVSQHTVRIIIKQ